MTIAHLTLTTKGNHEPPNSPVACHCRLDGNEHRPLRRRYFVTSLRFTSAEILKNGASVRAAYLSAADQLRQLDRLKGEPGFDLKLATATLVKFSSSGKPLTYEQEIPLDGAASDLMPTKVKVDSAGRKAGAGFVQVTLFLGPL